MTQLTKYMENDFKKTDYTDYNALILVIEDLSIYPIKVVGGEHAYEKRTEYMEGWNACAISIPKQWLKITRYFKTIPPELVKLIIEENIRLTFQDDIPVIYVQRLGLFGLEFEEDITESDFPDFLKAHKESPIYGNLLWYCRKYQKLPNDKFFQIVSEAEAKLFIDIANM